MFSHIHFQSLDATDLERAKTFWCDVIGCEVAVDAPYDESRWIMLRIESAQTLIHLNQVEDVGAQKMPSIVLLSNDTDGACKTLAERGVTPVQGPDTAPWDPSTRYAMFHDSEGNLVLIQTIGDIGL